jgi:flavodoxin
MNTLIVFDTLHGNSERVARAIAAALEPTFSVRFARADQTAKLDVEGIDLLIVGGPTQRRRMSMTLTAVLDATPRGTLTGTKVAAFDTRYRMAAWLSGSAAVGIARHLRKLGGRLLISPQSFFVERDVSPKGHKRRHDIEQLEPGELERASEWTAEIVRAVAGG